MALNFDDDDGHVAFSRFGLRRSDEETELSRLMDDAGAMVPVVAQMATMMAYDTEYGIFPHNNPHQSQQRPWGMVAHHDKEEIHEGSKLYSHIRRFHTHRISKHFGLSLKEFLEFPEYIADELYEISASESRSDEKVQNQVDRQMNLGFE